MHNQGHLTMPYSEAMLDDEDEMITIVLESSRWDEVIPNAVAWATRIVEHVLDAFDCTDIVAVVLADDAMVQRLNAEFRGKDKPTNVLSFPADEVDEDMLGDIILSVQTLEREASEQGKSIEHHAAHLLVHGMLHLLGYDHELSEEDAEEMESEEIALLDELGIANPYV